MISDEDSQRREQRSQKNTDIADLDGDVEEVQDVVNCCRGDH